MTAQYDSIAAAYQRTKEAPLRRYLEAPSFLQRVGDVRGLRVLDLACGDGYYSRALRRAGAAHVTGVDISVEMLALARAAEADEPLGIEYLHADVAELPALDPVDVVSAAYLLHYAASVAELEMMCRNIARQLAPGGRLVSINENPDQPADDYPGYTQYGFNKHFVQPRQVGSEIHYTMVSGRELLSFTAYYYDRDTYAAALRAAGFREIRWSPLRLTAAADGAGDAGYFLPYLENPPVVLLDCRL
jgi:ubiquinone/menaquinone biosynthesis C-methylase UbiE